MLNVEVVESYRITARPPESVPPVCPGCGLVAPKLYKFGTLHPEFADVPHHGRPTLLVVERQRWRCRECGKTFQHPVDELDERRMATRRLVEYVQKRSSEDTFSRIARDTGLHEKTVRNIVSEYHKDREGKRQFLPPRILGLDEVYLLRRPRAVITNLEANTMIDLLANRYRTTVEKRLREITPPGSVEVACMDMWKDYRTAIRNVHPDAAVVVDKFHIQRYANVAVETVRRRLRAELTKAQRVTLKRERGVLLRRRHTLQERDLLKLEGWTGSFPWLSRAYDLKENFYDIWDSPTRAEAQERYMEWVTTVPDELVTAFKPIMTAVTNWEGEIFAYWDHPYTNAATEALNGLTKMMNRMGRGYSFEVLRSKLLDRPAGSRGGRPAAAVDDHGDGLTDRGLSLSTLNWLVTERPEEFISTLESE